MRSDRMARLAGVTVRTIRHYHQIGLLPEPPRSANGYRDYSAADLATLVRIHSFAELGIPLAEISRVLGDPTATDDLLTQIDEQAEADIARLTARRRDIAALRQNGAAPDLPASLARYVSLMTTAGSVSAEGMQYEREQLALLSRFVSVDGWESIARTLEDLRAAGEHLDDLSRRFLALPEDAPEDEWRAIAEEMMILIAPLASSEGFPPLGDEAAALLSQHQKTFLNSAQERVLARITELADSQG
jgi:DNA-binding transcriptional MerR regulator